MDRFEVFTKTFLKINRLVQKIKSMEMQEYGLKGTTIMCLYFAYRNQNVTSKDLVKLCEEDKAQISRALKELEDKGLIKYTSINEKKKYNTIINLTEEGKNVGFAISKKAEHVFSICGSVLTEEERTSFYNCLSKIAVALEDYVLSSEKWLMCFINYSQEFIRAALS